LRCCENHEKDISEHIFAHKLIVCRLKEHVDILTGLGKLRVTQWIRNSDVATLQLFAYLKLGNTLGKGKLSGPADDCPFTFGGLIVSDHFKAGLLKPNNNIYTSTGKLI
jgi:hypothetical protein